MNTIQNTDESSSLADRYLPEAVPVDQQYVQAPHHGFPQNSDYPQEKRNPLNLNTLAFGLLVFVITTIIIAAALGGGLGAELASCRHDLR